MSDIPKSERTESRLRAQHQAYQIRARITAELMASFAYSQKKQEAHIRKMVQHVKDPEACEEMANYQTLSEREIDFCQGIASHLRAANTIWPTYMNEFLERRLEMDRAMECCNQLQDELQYIAEALPADKNKYTSIVLDVQAEFETVKALRQSDNRFLKKIKQ